MKHILRALRFGLAAACLAAPAAAQVVVAPMPRGWIGVSLEVSATTEADGTIRTVSRVTDVMEGSPAAVAGIRPGDVIVSINGVDRGNDLPSATAGLRPGDPVSIVLEREGRRREVRLTAGTRPMEGVALPSWTVTVGADSIAEYLYKAMDSLRIRIVRGEQLELPAGTYLHVTQDSLRWSTGPGKRVVVRMEQQGEHSNWVTVAPFDEPPPGAPKPVVVPEVRAPFEFFIFRGAEHDSLRTEMERLNREIRDLRIRQATRSGELARGTRGAAGGTEWNDPELRRIGEALAHAGSRADGLRSAMEAAARRGALADVPAPPTADEDATSTVSVGLRPLAPYLLGQNRAAGAEVMDLRPELAAYFQVGGGVLVVDVPPGTVAEAAGIQPGDVVTHVDGSAVKSIGELRRGLAGSATELPLTLVRKGRTIQVLLRR